MQKFLAVIGGFVLLVILVGCGFLGALAVNANQAAIRLNEFPVTLRAIDPPAQDAPQIPPTPRVEVETVVIEVTAVPLPTNPPLPTVVFATSQPTPAPTRRLRAQQSTLPPTLSQKPNTVTKSSCRQAAAPSQCN